ncbi:hypothetical protein KC19_4G109800 [Ceratodon purpureus]|uniref:Uncharacterized protein n=1 Tax=Ceratodon purpureus TaxID=3225 RepID=A0A8T0I9G6_CERPU|nr:hypothetical protein KC19_4G109800 [Ceratodon purpureus]KAG0579607.1 hypothetical protein KC19_4G109800 [Ceratodon purpureus]KAG0579608.1 hypothetical protein KC19_4G109800 [Ceratodon purpureus]KAG0579609.1 hypothetical protein KC19_4G109800 [Ceratodon purpureus]
MDKERRDKISQYMAQSRVSSPSFQHISLHSQQQRSRLSIQQKKIIHDDCAKIKEAKLKAGIAAQKRAEAFEKSAWGKAAKKAVIAAKSSQ